MVSGIRTVVLGLTLTLIGAPAFALDDHGDTCGTASALTTDGTVVGAIVDPLTDEDWLSFSADAGHRYQATTFTPSASFYYVAQVIGPDCVSVVADWNYYSPDELSVVPPTTDTYYVRFASYASASVGYIEIGLMDQGAVVDDHSGSRAGATAIAADGSATGGSIDYVGDVDWFAFNGSGQHLYVMEIRALSTSYSWLASATLYSDSYGIGSSGWSGADADGPPGEWMAVRYFVPSGADGAFQIRVDGYPGLTGPYEVRVADLGIAAGDDHGDGCPGATAIATDGTVRDIIIDPQSDEDWLSFFAEAPWHNPRPSNPPRDRTGWKAQAGSTGTDSPPPRRNSANPHPIEDQ